jgi:hypothetical protein
VRTSGTWNLEYFAVARPGYAKDTRLDGKFESRLGAVDEQQARGGRVVRVRQSTTWELAEDETIKTAKKAEAGGP